MTGGMAVRDLGVQASLRLDRGGFASKDIPMHGHVIHKGEVVRQIARPRRPAGASLYSRRERASCPVLLQTRHHFYALIIDVSLTCK